MRKSPSMPPGSMATGRLVSLEDLPQRLNRRPEAAASCLASLNLAPGEPERRYLAKRHAEVSG
jgi:predicted RNA polymerase sigma factor